MQPGALAAFLYLCFMWGSTYLFIKIGLDYWPPILMAAARNGIAALFLVAVMGILRRPWPNTWRGWWPPIGFGVINGTAFALIFWGEQYIPSGQTAVLIATMPIFTLFFARWLLKERITWVQAVAVVVGILGVLLASGVRDGAGFVGTDAQRLFGQVAMLGAALCYGAAYVFGRRFFQADTYFNTTMNVAAASVYLLILSLILDPPVTDAVFAWQSVLSVLYLAIPGSALAYLAMFYMMQHASSLQSSFFTVINPIVALLLGVVLLGEALTWAAVFGTVLVLVAVWLVNRQEA